jgi:hypothetical protein
LLLGNHECSIGVDVTFSQLQRPGVIRGGRGGVEQIGG